MKRLLSVLLVLALTVAVVVPLLNTSVLADEPLSTGDRYGETASGENQRLEFYKAPYYTQDSNGNWVSYVFTDNVDHYKIQAARASIKLYDYYTEVWTEDFSKPIIYDDRWTVEYQNKQGKWTDTSFWNIVRSYQIVSDDEIRVLRTGDTTIGQRQEVCTFKVGEPCKIEIKQTCNEAQTIRFVWKPSGIVASYETAEFDEKTGKQKGLAYYDSGNFVARFQWFNELEIASAINTVCESHVQGRKATITFGNFSVLAGGMASLDPLYEYYNTGDDARLKLWSATWGAQTFTPAIAHKITSVKLLLYRNFSPGTITVSIKATDGNGQPTGGDLCSGTTDGDTLPNSLPYEWRAITLGDGYDLEADTKYAIVVRALSGNTTNYLNWRYDGTDPTYTSGNYERSEDSGSIWTSDTDRDLMFEEWGEPAVVAPTVTTQTVSNIGTTTATGNGTITDTGGENCTKRGVCWNTTGNPTVADSKSEETGSFGTGAFTRPMTGLTSGQHYYVKAYAYNSEGYGYGSQVEFTTLETPSVTTNAATYVAATTARLNSTLTDDGGEACEVRFQYYTGAGTWTDNETAWVGGYTTGQHPYADITELSTSTLYHFRVQAKNSVGTTNGASVDFTTESGVSEPTNFKAFPEAERVVLSWTKGAGSTNTHIRYKEGLYPTGITDGSLVYDGELGTCTHVELTPGHSYFYSAWGVSGEDTSEPSYETVMATTLAMPGAGEEPGAPPVPPTWFQTPDYTALSGLPFYVIANVFFDSYEMPRASGWFFTAIFGCIVFGLFVFAVSRHPVPTLIALAVAIATASLIKLLPMWMMAFTVIFMIGAFQFGKAR